MYRQDVYEIPPAAIRELIINAAVHRSYLDNGNIQVAIFDNRLEITSPGKLPVGQTVEKMREGYSKVRNEALAMSFSYMHLIERWGTGMLRIAEMIREAGLGDLEIIDGGTELRFNIYRKHDAGQTPKAEQVSGQNAGQTPGQTPEIEQASGQNAGQTPEENIQEELLKLSSDEKTVLKVLQTSPQIIVRDIAQQLEFSRSAVSRLMRKLKDKGIIERIGSNRKGYWKINL